MTIVECYRHRGFPQGLGLVASSGASPHRGDVATPSEIDKLREEQISLADHMTPAECAEAGVPADVLLALDPRSLLVDYRLSSQELERALQFASGDIQRLRWEEMPREESRIRRETGLAEREALEEVLQRDLTYRKLQAEFEYLVRRQEHLKRWMESEVPIDSPRPEPGCEAAAPERPVDATTPSRHQVRSSCGEKTVMALVILAAILVLTRLVSDQVWLGGSPDSDTAPGAGLTVRTEITDVFLHPSLELARRHPLDAPLFRSHEALRRHLRERGLDRIWYAILVRHSMRDQTHVEFPIIHHPCEDQANSYFGEVRAILALAAGKEAVRLGPIDLSTTRVHTIPEQLLKHGPRDVIHELLLRQSMIGQERAR
jgi:hypothetical protein